MLSDQPTLYELVGGEPTFRQLVDMFYATRRSRPGTAPGFPG